MFNKAHNENCKQLEQEMKKMAESEKSKMAPNESERLLHTPIQSGNVKWFSLQHKLSNSQTKEIMYNRAWQRNPIREKSNWCDGKISLVFAKNVHLAGWLNLTCTYRILMICRRRLGWTCPSVRWVSRAYFPFSVYWTSSCNWFWYCISVSSVYIIIYHELPFLLEQIWSRQYNPCSLVCNL